MMVGTDDEGRLPVLLQIDVVKCMAACNNDAYG